MVALSETSPDSVKPSIFVQAMNGLAMAYYFAGQTDKALALAAETLRLRKRHLDPSDIDILVSMSNLGALHLWLNQIERALPLFAGSECALR